MKILLVFAHPDDESFTCGATVSQLASEGNEINLVCATKGEAGELGSPPLCSREELGLVREKELLEASKILGIRNVRFLNYYDGILGSIDSNELKTKVLQELEKQKPNIVITFDKEGGTNHPDHIAISKATTLAFKEYKLDKKEARLYHTANPKSRLISLKKAGLEYVAFGEISGQEEEELTTLAQPGNAKSKIEALKKHKTQQLDWERYLKSREVADVDTEYFLPVF